MQDTKQYIKVILDQEATILKLECTFLDITINPDKLIGRNWFDTCIHKNDKESIFEIFSEMFQNEKKWKTYANKISFDKQSKLIDFDNEIVIKDTQKLLYSTGFEHSEEHP